jgi:catechol 2,3-dioxygenase-like lactoylglutathione lyase family enzyme
MRGAIHHLDLTVKDPWASRPFYDEVLGFIGYRNVKEDAYGFDYEREHEGGAAQVCIRKAEGEGLTRKHDRYSPGLHHVAWRADSRNDVTAMHELLKRIGANILDAPADYPQYSEGYYAVFFTDPDGLKLEFVYSPT